jgi:hypothetical protein
MHMRVEIDNTVLKVYADGSILRKLKSDKWKEIEDKQNHIKGYNVILISKKQYMRSKIIAFAYLNQDLYDNSHFICHKDNNKMNSSADNLFIKAKGNVKVKTK